METLHSGANPSEVSLYFHIPLCTKKCPYCHFYVVPNRTLFKNCLSESLALEWQREISKLSRKKISSIYFGGGTPTLFAPDGIKSILKNVWTSGLDFLPNCEVTIEANPEECDEGLLEQLIALKINRISFGVQSFDNRSLTVLERNHSAKKAKAAIFKAHDAGFRNISIDLMYDLPDQTEASWHYTLDQIRDLPIAHLSLYNLTIEPHTSFYKRQRTLSLPNQVTSLRLLQAAIAAFEKAGLKRYEISAFAKPGFESRHNTGYWTGRPFLGFGPSAFSYWNGERFRNIANLQRYALFLKKGQSPIDFREQLPYPSNLKELFAIHLRLVEGVSLIDFSPLPTETEAAIEKWIKEGLLSREKNRVRLTTRGMLFYDEIAADMI